MVTTKTIQFILQDYESASNQAAQLIDQALEKEIPANYSGLNTDLLLGNFGYVLAWNEVENFYSEVFTLNGLLDREPTEYKEAIFFLTVAQHMSYARIAGKGETEYKYLATGTLFLVRDQSQNLVDINFPIYRVENLGTPFLFYRVVAEKFFPSRFTNWVIYQAGQTFVWGDPKTALIHQLGQLKYCFAVGVSAIQDILRLW